MDFNNYDLHLLLILINYIIACDDIEFDDLKSDYKFLGLKVEYYLKYGKNFIGDDLNV